MRALPLSHSGKWMKNLKKNTSAPACNHYGDESQSPFAIRKVKLTKTLIYVCHDFILY